jgi:glycosyltransferase involved in cell wall biosynthesis
MNKKYSIIIPTYNHLEDCLKPCIESIIKYTNIEEIEIIVIANGCNDGTEIYLQSLDQNLVKYKIIPEALGYTKATNIGILQAIGEYVILLNNDVLLLDQPKNLWLDMMEKPFLEQDKVGITGPLKLHDIYVNSPVVIFFCAMIPRKLFYEFGLLDEIFSPGGCEDIDFTMKVLNAGYKCLQVPSDEKILFTGTNTSIYPIWHQNNKTFSENSDYGKIIIKRNGLVVLKRHNKNIKLNIGSGYLGFQHYGFLSIDSKVETADLVDDILNIDFDENSVTEIYAGHLLNHNDTDKAIQIVNKIFKILKPGGFVAFEQSDMSVLCAEYLKGDFNRKLEISKLMFEAFNFGKETYGALSAWEPNTLVNLLSQLGFTDIMTGNELVPRPGYNFRIQARKPL